MISSAVRSPLVGRDNRPNDTEYFEQAGQFDQLQQGDIFRDVPLFVGDSFSPLVPQLNGPLESVTGVLVSPDAYLRTMQDSAQYDQLGGPVNLAPIRTLSSLLGSPLPNPVPDWFLNMRDFDEVEQYMYLPTGVFVEECAVSFPNTFVISSKLLHGQRIARLAAVGARQLRRKITMFFCHIDVAISSIP